MIPKGGIMKIDVYEKKETIDAPNNDVVAIFDGSQIVSTNSWGMQRYKYGYSARNVRFVIIGKAISKLLPERRRKREEYSIKIDGFSLFKSDPTTDFYIKKKHFVINDDDIDNFLGQKEELNRVIALKLMNIDLIRDLKKLIVDRNNEKFMRIKYSQVLRGIEYMSLFNRIFRFKKKMKEIREI